METLLKSEWILVERLEPSTLSVRFGGRWDASQSQNIPDWRAFADALAAAGALSAVRFEASRVDAWDSALPAFVLHACELAQTRGLAVDMEGLPEGLRKIVDLALAVPAKADAAPTHASHNVFWRLGEAALQVRDNARDGFSFLGELSLALWRFFTGRARFRWKDFWLILQKCGADDLPIVKLISFLLGMILAYVGIVQLQQFGATIYVANLVAIAMVREMGAMMTGVIMSGRTGAAFAAELGSMKVSDEIPALRTFGISPYEFLVAPRVVAVVLMMPLLVLYSNLMGILGGAVVSVGMEMTTLQYMTQALKSINLTAFSSGMIKSVVFGAIVAYTGCLRGMRSGSSSESVGRATTSAVVTSITWIIVADAVFAVLFNLYGI